MRPARIDLDGAVVAITGAGRGIGLAAAMQFAERGARVAIGDLDYDAAMAAAGEVGGGARALALDVSQRESFAAFVAAAEAELGPIDVLVNNAGVMPAGRFLDEDDATTALTLGVNLWGPIHGMRLVLPGMIERGRGHVVNVASMAGKVYVPGLAVYVASKHALLGLHRTVREEIDGTGVTVSVVLPTAVRTELASGFSLRGIGAVDPEDVAAAIAATVESRAAEVAVPGWLRAYDVVPLLPGPVVRLGRRVLGQNRALAPADAAARAAYEERIRSKP